MGAHKAGPTENRARGLTREVALAGLTGRGGIHGDKLIIRCRELHDIGRQVSETLLEVLGSVTRKQKIYIFKHRVKPSKAIWQKVHRNRNEGRKLRKERENTPPTDKTARETLERRITEAESFGPNDVFDGFGCRYVTLFEEQRLALIRDLFDAFDGFKVPAAVDVPIKLTNCSIYYAPTASGAEERATELVEILRSVKFAPRIIPDRTVIKIPIARPGYSSVHFNFELPVIVDFPRGDHPLDGQAEPEFERARFEVQIRDVFEEAWSESEHYLFYSQKDEFRELSDQQMEKIREAKELVDTYRANIDVARNYLSLVKMQLDRTRGPVAPDLDTKSTTARIDDKSAIRVTLKDEVAPEALEILDKAYALLHDAENAETVIDAARKYAEASEQLQSLRKAIGPAMALRVGGRFNRPVKYFIETELANSWIFSHQPEAAGLAKKLYADLIDEYPSDPTLKIRYGRALSLQSDLDADQIKQLLDLMKNIKALVEKDELTGPKHWLPMTAFMLQGYAHGRLSGTHLANGRKEEALQEMEAAVVSTREATAYWRGLPPKLREEEIYKLSAFKASSNVIYYLAQLVQLGGGDKPQFDRQAIKEQIAENDEIKVRKFPDYYKSLDNRMHGLVVIGDHENAVKLAKEIYGTLQGLAATRAGRSVEFHEIGNFLNNDERMNLNAAVNVVISQGRQWT